MNIFFRVLLEGQKHWLRVALGFGAMLLAGLVAAWPSVIFKVLIDILASGKLFSESITFNPIPQSLGLKPFFITLNPAEFLNWIPLIILLLFALDGLLNFISFFQIRFFGILITNELRQKAHSKLLNLSFGQIRSRNSGDLISCLTNDLNLVQALTAEVLTALIKDSMNVTVLCLWLLITDWKLSLIGLIVLPTLFIFISKLTKKLRKLSNKGQEVVGVLASFISETIQGVDLVNLFNIQKIRHQEFQAKSQDVVRVWRKQLLIDGSIGPILNTMVALTISLIIWFGLKQVFAGQKTIGDFSSYIIAVILLYQPLKRLSRAHAQISQISGTSKRVFEIIDLKPEVNNLLLPIYKHSPNSKIEFKNVNFRYGLGPIILQNINLNIEEGEQIALVGFSGSGKSTIIKLIPRLYNVTEGSLEIKGLNVQNWDLTELRDLISFVPQEPFLFSGSFKDNLLLASPQASDQELKKALELAKVDFINSLEEAVDERGFNLSGGQRQRIAIARAFLKNSPLLILDEPTSSLDQQSEELIKQSLIELRKNRTVILVTHKMSSIKDFSRIICMKNGQIIEEGDHKSLMDKVNYYYQLTQTNL